MKTLITIFCMFLAIPVCADELNPIAVPLPYDTAKSLSYDTPEYDPSLPATITVLLVYTSAAEAFASTHYNGGLSTLITGAMDYAQTTADNSQVGIEFEVAGTMETSYVESGDSSTDLRRLTDPSDGYMDDVHKVRDNVGADLVVLLAEVNDVGGVGWLMTRPGGDSRYGFSLVRVQQMAGSSTVHEMGHNMGLHHHKDQTAGPGPGVFSYSAGGRWVGSDGVPYCSVMTYTGGSYFPDGIPHSRIPIFSSPEVLHFDVPTGDAVDADNARTAREMKHVIAAYRFEGGSLQVNIEPAEAQWRLVDGQTWYDSGHQLNLPIGPTEIEFSDVRGWIMPQSMMVQVDENVVTTINVAYEIETCIVLIAPTANGRLVPSQQVVNYGETATFQIKPDNGYKLGAVFGCGGSLSRDTYTTGPVVRDCTIKSRFDKIQTPVVTSSDGGGGGGCFISAL